MKNIKKHALSLISNSLSLVGAILLAFSVQVRDLIEEIGMGFVIERGGETINQTETIINASLFHWGIFLLIIGFILQIINTFKKA